jgi:hypothetical protein
MHPRVWPIALSLVASSAGLGGCGLLTDGGAAAQERSDASHPSDAAIANADASTGTDARGSDARGWNSTCEPLPPLPGPDCVYVAAGALCRYPSGIEICICLASGSEESHSIWDCGEEEDAGSVQTDEAGVDGGSICELGACEDAGEGRDASTFRCGIDTCDAGHLCATAIGGGGPGECLSLVDGGCPDGSSYTATCPVGLPGPGCVPSPGGSSTLGCVAIPAACGARPDCSCLFAACSVGQCLMVSGTALTCGAE